MNVCKGWTIYCHAPGGKRPVEIEGTIAVNPEKCTNCKACEIACSIWHEGKATLHNSRIKVQGWKDVGAYFPVVCQNCEKPVCEEICPTKARVKAESTGAMVTDATKCVGCKSCIMACPFAAPNVHRDTRKTMTCDLCGGDPACVKFCKYDAISYVPFYKAAMNRKRAYYEVLRRASRAGQTER